jgi:hypothetical protein
MKTLTHTAGAAALEGVSPEVSVVAGSVTIRCTGQGSDSHTPRTLGVKMMQDGTLGLSLACGDVVYSGVLSQGV